MRIPVLLITGPVAVGKTSVVAEIADTLKVTGIHFAAVDFDALSYCYPPTPGDDRYRTKLTFRNLAAVWRNFRKAGAERLLLACVLESRDDLVRFRRAIPGADVTVVRLHAKAPALRERVDRREVGLGRAWHRQRAVELAKIMDAAKVEDILVETDKRTISVIAREILERTGWLDPLSLASTSRRRLAKPATHHPAQRPRAPSRRSGG
jgi:adenylylsulfate kinase-like enzyme